ncbi:MAG TPA: gamma-glutamyl-phosphate reductase, partial [Erythrobacter sp.]|nr:gamma-glutamyl-phosphate reductase [Erythrobacter sp.]
MTDQTPDPQIHIHDLGQRARKAARALLSASTEAKNNALREAAKALRSRMGELLEANGEDVQGV